MATDLERLAVDIERPIGCISRAVFWVLFVIFGAILGVLGWFLYTLVLVNHPITFLTNTQKDAVIVALSVVVLAMALAAIVRDSIRNAIYRRVQKRRARN